MSTAASQLRSDTIRRIVLMGVAGCGKSTVGAMLSNRLSASYIDGDDLHPSVNIEKMRRGEPLTDDDRWPWLALVGRRLADVDGVMILGCSALKRRYRDHIRENAQAPVMFVHLSGSRTLIASRIAFRTGHFMPATLVDSQFADLETPARDEEAITVDIDQPLEILVEKICSYLESVGRR